MVFENHPIICVNLNWVFGLFTKQDVKHGKSKHTIVF